MKKKLLSQTRLTQLLYSFCMILFCANFGWGQHILGDFPNLDGGMENQTATTTMSSSGSTGPIYNDRWTVSSTSNAQTRTIYNDVNGSRSGDYYAGFQMKTTVNNLRLQSPTPTTAFASNTQYTIQYFFKAPADPGTYLRSGIYFNGTVSSTSSSPASTLVGTFTADTWTKAYSTINYTPASVGTIQWATVRLSTSPTSNLYNSLVSVDDFIVYLGAYDDVPAAPVTGATVQENSSTSHTVNWNAPSTGVDGGGYVIVRYTANPGTADDINNNGIYKVGNTTASGEIVYIGTSTTFTDNAVPNGGTNIYYKIYTVDKAFNYNVNDEVTVTYTPTGSSITYAPTFSDFDYTAANGPSAVQTSTVTGNGLTSSITLSNIPVNFELSTDNFTTVATLANFSLPTSGGSLSVRLKAGLTNGNYSENFTLQSGTASLLITCNGSVSGTYTYSGSGSLSDSSNWTPTPDLTGTGATFIIQGTAVTDAVWVLGTNSKVVVGDPTLAGASLTITDTFPITGTVDIPAALLGSNKLYVQDAMMPTYGTLDVSSEVHFDTVVDVTFPSTAIFGNLYADALSASSDLTFRGNPTIQSGGSFTVTDGATLFISGAQANYMIFENGSSATIDGKLRIQKVAGFVNSNVSSPSTSFGSLQFKGAENITLGANSLIAFDKANNSSIYNVTGGDYVNLEISGVSNPKTILGPITVSKELTIDVETSALTALTSSTPITILPSGKLTLTSGTLNTGGFLTLKSDATGTAVVGEVTGGSVSGDVVVERYIPAKRGWRLLTAPLKGTTGNTISANWQGTASEGLLLFSPATYQSQAMVGYTTGGVAPNIFSYNSGWSPITNLTTENMYGANETDTKAYQVFSTGPFGSTNIVTGSDATTLRPKGELITGTVTHTLTANAFKLVPNPYASPIDTESLITNNSGSKIWLLDPTAGTGTYFTYDGSNWAPSVPTSSDAYIQSGQGFFVKSTGTSFSIQESDKVEGNSNTWFEKNTTSANDDKIRVLLQKQNNSQWQTIDGILTVNNANGNTAVDNTDAGKISNFNENIIFRNGTSNLSIEYRALPIANETQQIRLTGTSVTAYQLQIFTENYSNSNLIPVLENIQTGTFTQIPTDGSVLTIPFSGVVSNSTTPDDHFRIVYQTPLSNNSFDVLNVSVYPNPVNGGVLNINLLVEGNASYNLYNVVGQEVQKGNLTSKNSQISMSNLHTGIYILSINQEGKNYTSKLIVE